MGSCIICGAPVSIDSGDAWKITPAERGSFGFERMHWIHARCIDRVASSTSGAARV